MAKKIEKENVKFVDYSKDLPAAIRQVQKDGQKLKHKIHNVALSIVRAWGTKVIESNVAADYFTGLAAAAGYHGKALADWISVKLPLEYSEETEVWFARPDAKVNGDTFKECRDEPFWEISPPPKAKPFMPLALLEKILERQSSKASDPAKVKEGDKLLSGETVNALRDLIRKEKSKEDENVPH